MEAIHLSFKDIYPFLLLLARVGGIFITAPGLGESYIPPQIRLLCALTICIALAPVLTTQQKLIDPPTSGMAIMALLSIEISIGLFTGLAIKTIFAALHVAGSIIGYQIGLMNAFVSDPTFEEQTALPGIFLTVTASFLIFATDIHHSILHAIIQSYHMAPPRNLPSFTDFMGDASQILTAAGAASLQLAVQISGPFMALGLLLYAGLGIINRLLPQVQVFFVVQPLIIFLGFLILILVIPVIFPLFMEHLKQFIQTVWNPA